MEVFAACAAAALYRRDAFEALGGFEERFFCYYEDVDLGFRLRLAGGRCVLEPRAIVRHVGSASSGQVSGFAEYHGTRNRLWTFLRDMPTALMPIALPAPHPGHRLRVFPQLFAQSHAGRTLARAEGRLGGAQSRSCAERRCDRRANGACCAPWPGRRWISAAAGIHARRNPGGPQIRKAVAYLRFGSL